MKLRIYDNRLALAHSSAALALLPTFPAHVTCFCVLQSLPHTHIHAQGRDDDRRDDYRRRSPDGRDRRSPDGRDRRSPDGRDRRSPEGRRSPDGRDRRDDRRGRDRSRSRSRGRH